MLWYNIRDDLFAPFEIKTTNYTKDWQLILYAFVARRFPIVRRLMIRLRTWRRSRRKIPLDDLRSRASVVIGHFAVYKLLPYLSPDEHEYRTVVRDPLARMWSHFNHFNAHKGDVGQRVVPRYRENMKFEEFALLPEMLNYQYHALGGNLSIYKHIGVTERLEEFCRNTGLIDSHVVLPKVNHFGNEMPIFDADFLNAFKKAHILDYNLYNSVSKVT